MSLSFRDRATLCRCFGTLAAVPATFFAPNCPARPDIRLEADANVLLSDNPFLISGEHRGAAAVEIVARPEFDWSVAPATSLEASATVALRHYLRRYGDFVTGRALASIRHRDSEFLSLNSSVSYARELPTDARPTASMQQSTRAASGKSIRRVRRSTGPRTQPPRSAADFGAQRARYPTSTLLSTTNAYDLGVGLSKRVSPVMSLGVRGANDGQPMLRTAEIPRPPQSG